MVRRGEGGIHLPAFHRTRNITCLQQNRRMHIAERLQHRLNMQLDPQSLFGLHVHSYTHWLRLRNPPPPTPPHLGSYTRALLFSQDRRHLFVTPCSRGSVTCLQNWHIFAYTVLSGGWWWVKYRLNHHTTVLSFIVLC